MINAYKTMSATQKDRSLYLATPLGSDYLMVNNFRVTESLSKLFELELELVHEERQEGVEATVVKPERILGQSVTLRITQRDQTERFFNGLVVNFSQGQRDNWFSYYRATVVPRVWLLTQKSQSRIFQHLSVPDILKQVFEGIDVKWELQGTFEPRNYCVQYRETDFDFASRLMEEEGIYYFFKHENNKHTMIVANTAQSHLDCPTKHEVDFALKVEQIEDYTSAVGTWFIEHKLRTGTYSLWDHNFQLPSNKLSAQQPSRFNIANNRLLEVYDYPGGYARRHDGIAKDGGDQSGNLQKIFDDRQRTIEIRQQEIDAQYKIVKGTSDCCSFTAGHRFKLTNHSNSEQNIQHILVTVEHTGKQSPAYQTGESDGEAYVNTFTCIPYGSNHAPYRPPRETPKPVVRGSQTAVVVGPAGEEVFVDKYGRVKVQFHWDREGQNDARSSCWLRVAQSWAGKRWGMIFIPRIGMEVIVDFLEGDPDQPIITGCVYNPEQMPPYDLPDNKTQSGLKTRSSKGGDSSNFNEFRFEDKKGQEEIYLHAEKNWTIMVENDKNQTVGHDETHRVKHNRTKTVDNDETSTIKHNRTETVENDEMITIIHNRTESVGDNETITVGKDRKRDVIGEHITSVGKSEKNSVAKHRTDNIGEKYTLTATTSITESAKEITITAGTKLTLAGPGGSIVIEAGVVTITGALVKIN